MKKVYIIILLCLIYSESAKSQYRSTVYFDTLGNLDFELMSVYQKADSNFWTKNYESSLIHFEELLKIKPNDFVAKSNIVLIQALLEKKEFKKEIKNWISYRDTNAICSCLEKSDYFLQYRKRNWFKDLISECWKLKNKQKISNPVLSDKIQFHLCRDQEILLRPNFASNQSTSKKDSMLVKNLEDLKQIIPLEKKLPSINEVGYNGCYALYVMFLHIDSIPSFQYAMAEKMSTMPDSYKLHWVDDLFEEARLNK